MSLLAALKRAFLGDFEDCLTLDHVPAGSMDCRTPDKIAAAREKLGRPFAPEIKVDRMTEPSHLLEHINQRAAERKSATVTPINRKSKS